MTETALAVIAGGATDAIEKAKLEGCNLLLPSQQIEGLSEFHQPIIERVLLSSNPEDGDVYAHDMGAAGPKKKWRPTKQALMKLSVCAGVIWSVTESRRIDNGADRNYIAYRAVGGIRKADGQPVFFSADYDLDLEVVEEELRESYNQKNIKNKEKGWSLVDVEACVKRDLLQKRKNKLKLCEAGSMNRVLRMLLGIKQAYTTEELAKPFVIMRVVFRPDYNDKDVRAKMIDASIKAMTGIYGTEAISQAPKPEAEPIDVTPIDDENGKEPYPSPAEPEPAVEPEPEPTAEKAPEAQQPAKEPEPSDPAVDFAAMDANDQAATLERMSKRKGYDLDNYLKRSKKASAKDLSALARDSVFAYLLQLPNAPAATK